MSVAALIRRLMDVGAPSEAIAIAVEAIEAERAKLQAELDGRKAAARAKKQRQRASCPETVPGQAGDAAGTEAGPEGDIEGQTLSLPPSPQTPQPPTHTREKITTRVKRASRRCPADWQPSAKTYALLAEEGIAVGDLERALTRMRDHEFRDAHSDWDAVFRNWVRTDRDRRSQPRTANDRPNHDQRQSARDDSLRNMHAGALAALNRRVG